MKLTVRMRRRHFRLKEYKALYFLQCEGDGVDLQERPITEEDWERFASWTRTYQRAQRQTDAAQLLALGKQIYQWLDDGHNWLSKLKENRKTPFVIEFQTSMDPGNNEHLFLEAPWELVADDNDLLAGNINVLFCPVRRIGKPNPETNNGVTPYRLSAVFMAAAPETNLQGAGKPLRYEDEERAIFEATGDLGMDMVVEESGNLDQLARTVSTQEGLHVLHVSCHGNILDTPVLFLETDEGDLARVTPQDFAREFGEIRPRVLFASACKTGESDGKLMHSYCSSLVQSGWPAVLGWSGSVQDAEATRFAAVFYKHLSKKDGTLSAAVAYARQELLRPPDTKEEGKISKYWHMARIYLGPQGGGPICGGQRARRMGGAQSGVKEFLDRNNEVPVAGRWEFVGRRREIQKVLRALKSKDKTGILIHGLGRQGKSSLAARVANRLADRSEHKTAVVFGRYDAMSILRSFADALPIAPVKDIVDKYLPIVNQEPSRLEQALIELLIGPCRERRKEDGHECHPVLLVIDDFEKALDDKQPFPHPVHPDYAEEVRAIIRAFKGAVGTRSGLVFTSRYTFPLPDNDRDLADDLFALPLPSFQEQDSRKQAEAKARDKGVHPENIDWARTDRIIKAAQGNPGLQDLLFGMLLDSNENIELDEILTEMEVYTASGQSPQQQDLLKFLENLAIDRLISLLGEGEKKLLSASTLFQIPVPEKILGQIAGELGYNGNDPFSHRIYGLGLWEKYKDSTAPEEIAIGCNPLVRSHLTELQQEEQELLAGIAVNPLFAIWGGEDGSKRHYLNDWELSRLALIARSANVIVHSAADAIRFLEQRNLNKAAGKFATNCLALLDHRKVVATADFYKVAGELFLRLGEMDTAATCITKALACFDEVDEQSKEQENFDYASVLLAHARFICQKGEVYNATRVLREAERRFNALGDRHSRAVTLGDIARIMVSKGDVDEALKLHQERLDVFDALGDKDGRANTLWSMAKIDLQKKDHQNAYEKLAESYSINMQLGRLDGISFVGFDLGQLFCGGGHKKDGLTILERSRDGFAKLGQAQMARQVDKLISQIKNTSP